MGHHLINSSDIIKESFDWYYSDEINKISPGSIAIVNTDVSGGSGIHWLCVLRLSKSKFYIYDPLGRDNQRVNSLGDEVLKTDRKDIYFYPFESQLTSRNDCGYFSLAVAKKLRDLSSRDREDRRLSPKIIDGLIFSLFGPDADRGDILTVKKILK
jgi:hypothetical protein